MIISLSGDPGSGKTSVARLLADRLGYHRYSMGDLRGKAALARGMTIDEFNKLGETDPATDHAVDGYQKELGSTDDNFIIDGRLSWHFVPRSFKVYLHCDPTEGARRIYEAKKAKVAGREDERVYASVEEAKIELQARVASDVRRYEKYYGVRIDNLAQYDLVIDTTKHRVPEETVTKILAAIEAKKPS